MLRAPPAIILADSLHTYGWATFLEFPRRYIELTDAEMQALDDIDRRARAEGRRAGHTHAVASGICVRADGRHLGRSRA